VSSPPTHIPEAFTYAGGVLIHDSWDSADAGEPKGERVGDYVLIELLGDGATAEVWWALDTRLKLAVALKIFRTENDRFDVDRVLQEARACSQIVSDHAVGVKAAGELPDGRCYIAMDLCADVSEGTQRLEVARNLNEVMPYGTDEVLRWVSEAARGVHDAHRVRVFHRDIKPGNLLCRPSKRSVHLTDFGLAAHARSSVAGTPPYMAPEQAFGLPPVDPTRDRKLLQRIDVYGLGATLYALLAGHSPYEPHEGCEDEALNMLDQVRQGPPVPLGDVETRFPVPVRVQRVVAKAMSREADERYDSALDLAMDLEALRGHRPTSLDTNRVVRFGLWLRREWRKVSSLASIAVLLGSLLVGLVQARWLRTEIEELSVKQHEAVTQHARTLGRLQGAQLVAAGAEAVARDATAAAESADAKALAAWRQARRVEEDATEAVAAASAAEEAALGLRDDAVADRDQALTAAAEAAAAAENARIEADEALAAAGKSAEAEARARAAIRRLEGSLASLKAELEAARASAGAWESEAGGLRSRVDGLEDDVRELEQRGARLVAENQRLKRVLAAQAGAASGP